MRLLVAVFFLTISVWKDCFLIIFWKILVGIVQELTGTEKSAEKAAISRLERGLIEQQALQKP